MEVLRVLVAHRIKREERDEKPAIGCVDRIERGRRAGADRDRLTSADETRDVFSPTFWDKRDGVQQVIFPGCHSNVGGGFADIALSDVALSWMIDRLSDVDVRLDRTLIKPAIEGRYDGLIQDDAQGWPLFGRITCRPRKFPLDAQAHGSLVQRVQLNPNIVKPSRPPSRYLPAGHYVSGAPLVAGSA